KLVSKSIIVGLLALPFFVLCYTKYNVEEITINSWGAGVEPGFLYTYIIIYQIIIFALSLYNLRKFRSYSTQLKNKIMIIGIGMWLGLWSATFTIDILILFGISEISIFAPLALLIPSLITFTAISKFKLANIQFTISRISSYFLVISLAVFTTISSYFVPMPTGYVLTALCFWVILWSLYGGRLRENLQTYAERKLIKDWYNPSALFNTISEEVSPLIDRGEIIMTVARLLDEIMVLQNYFVIVGQLNQNNSFTEYIVYGKHANIIEDIPQTNKFIEFIKGKKDRVLYEDIAEKMHEDGIIFQVLPNSLLLPLHSSRDLEGLIILGPRASESNYIKKDFDALRNIVNHITLILDRMRPYEEMKREFDSSQKRLHEAEVQLLRSQKNTSIAHMRRQFCHELRTPLSVIKLSTHELPANSENDPLKAEILTEVDDAMAIVNETLKLSDVDHLGERVETSFNINEAISRCLKLVPPQDYVINKQLQSVPAIKGVFKDMEIVFTNLMKNAIEAMPKGGTISIKSYSDQGDVFVLFSDTGVGIAEDQIADIWQPYISGCQSGFGNDTAGKGWGLTIVNRIIDEHAGHISVKNKTSGGVTFTLRLPALV
ncbi:MAG: HAMP domain-containing sensor histidine kinase, partial [Thermodesulfobacteriota bacterium]